MFVIVARCLFEASTEFMIWIFELSQGTLIHLSNATGKREIRIIQDMERDGWKNKVFYSNVEILLHRRPNSFHDE